MSTVRDAHLPTPAEPPEGHSSAERHWRVEVRLRDLQTDMAYTLPPLSGPSTWSYQPAPSNKASQGHIPPALGNAAGPYLESSAALPNGATAIDANIQAYDGSNGKLSSYGARAASLPPPAVHRRMPRRRTQEARDIIAMQNLLPQLLRDGDSHIQESQSKRPTIEPTSSYVEDDAASLSPDVHLDMEGGNGHSWTTPSTDHPLTAAESADMLERVQHDLLGMDITKLKGPLAEIARKNVAVAQPAPPLISMADATRAGMMPPYTSAAESMTVSPKEAFLDYDQKLESISPTPKYRERFASPMPSLFAPLAAPVNPPMAPKLLPGGRASIDGSMSPPFNAFPSSQPLARGQSGPAAVRSPTMQERAYPVRRSVEPEAAPRNAVRWVSTKREPSGLMQLLQPSDGSFDWSPSSEEGDGGLPLENPPTPPQPTVVPDRNGKPTMPQIDISQLYGSHPLSADLAYIHHVPEAPTFQVPASSTYSIADMTAVRRGQAPPVKMPEMPSRTSSASSVPGVRAARARGGRESSLPPPTPTESSERSTLEDDEDESDQQPSKTADTDEWTPGPTFRGASAAQSPATSRATGPSPAAQEQDMVTDDTPRAHKREAPQFGGGPDDDDDEEDDYEVESSDEDFERPAKKSKTNKGTAKTSSPRLRQSSKNGDGHIFCDYVDSQTGAKCNTAFRRPYDLARHKETKHSAGSKKPQWVCDTCQSNFSRKDALMRHARLRGHRAK